MVWKGGRNGPRSFINTRTVDNHLHTNKQDRNLLNFTNTIHQEFPHLTGYQVAVVNTVLNWLQYYHANENGSHAFSNNLIRKARFSPQKFKETLVNLGVGYFRDSYQFFDKEGKKGWCKEFVINDWVIGLRGKAEHEWVNNPRMVKYDGNRRTAKLEQDNSYQYHSTDKIWINKTELLNLRRTAKNGEVEKPEIVLGYIKALLKLMDRNGYIYAHYFIHPCGRHYAKGIIQCLPGIVRKAAFKGQYEYDMESCHASIISQDFPECKAIAEYVNRKNQIREEVAQRTGNSVKQVKTALNAIQYGANTTSETYSSLGVNNFHEFVNDEFVRRYIKDARHAAGSYIDNKVGKTNAAYHVFSVEASILEVLLEHCTVSLRLHDAIITPHRQDVDHLRQLVYAHTGYDIKFSEEML